MSTRQATRPVATGQAGKGQRQPKRLSWADVQKLITDVSADNDETTYLKLTYEGEGNAEHPVLRKGQTLKITGALTYAKNNNLMVQKDQNTVMEAWVYYPDLRIAGFVGDIIDFLAEIQHNTFPVGAKYDLVQRAIEQSGEQFNTWATQDHTEVSLNDQNRDDILYRNSFDPFATPVAETENAFGYVYNPNGGEEADIIDALYKQTRGERKEFPVQKFVGYLQMATQYKQNQIKVSPYIRGANTQKLINTFDDYMAALINYYRSNNYDLTALLAENRPGVKRSTKLEAIDVSDFNPNRRSGYRFPVSLPYNIKSGDKVIPTFTLDGHQVYAPIVFDPYSFVQARDFMNIIANPQRVIVKENGPEVVVTSEFQNFANDITQSINREAQAEGYLFPQSLQTVKGATATTEASASRRRRGPEPAAPAPAPAASSSSGQRGVTRRAGTTTGNVASTSTAASTSRQPAPAAPFAARQRQVTPAPVGNVGNVSNQRQGNVNNQRQTTTLPPRQNATGGGVAPNQQRAAFPAGQIRPTGASAGGASAFPPASRVANNRQAAPVARRPSQETQAAPVARRSSQEGQNAPVARRSSQEGQNAPVARRASQETQAPIPARRNSPRQTTQSPATGGQSFPTEEQFESEFEPYDFEEGEASASPNAGGQARSRSLSRNSSIGGNASPRVDFAE